MDSNTTTQVSDQIGSGAPPTQLNQSAPSLGATSIPTPSLDATAVDSTPSTGQSSTDTASPTQSAEPQPQGKPPHKGPAKRNRGNGAEPKSGNGKAKSGGVVHPLPAVKTKTSHDAIKELEKKHQQQQAEMLRQFRATASLALLRDAKWKLFLTHDPSTKVYDFGPRGVIPTLQQLRTLMAMAEIFVPSRVSEDPFHSLLDGVEFGEELKEFLVVPENKGFSLKFLNEPVESIPLLTSNKDKEKEEDPLFKSPSPVVSSPFLTAAPLVVPTTGAAAPSNIFVNSAAPSAPPPSAVVPKTTFSNALAKYEVLVDPEARDYILTPHMRGCRIRFATNLEKSQGINGHSYANAHLRGAVWREFVTAETYGKIHAHLAPKVGEQAYVCSLFGSGRDVRIAARLNQNVHAHEKLRVVVHQEMRDPQDVSRYSTKSQHDLNAMFGRVISGNILTGAASNAVVAKHAFFTMNVYHFGDESVTPSSVYDIAMHGDYWWVGHTFPEVIGTNLEEAVWVRGAWKQDRHFGVFEDMQRVTYWPDSSYRAPYSHPALDWLSVKGSWQHPSGKTLVWSCDILGPYTITHFRVVDNYLGANSSPPDHIPRLYQRYAIADMDTWWCELLSDLGLTKLAVSLARRRNIFLDKRVVDYITRTSQHYKPSPGNFLQLVHTAHQRIAATLEYRMASAVGVTEPFARMAQEVVFYAITTHIASDAHKLKLMRCVSADDMQTYKHNFDKLDQPIEVETKKWVWGVAGLAFIGLAAFWQRRRLSAFMATPRPTFGSIFSGAYDQFRETEPQNDEYIEPAFEVFPPPRDAPNPYSEAIIDYETRMRYFEECHSNGIHIYPETFAITPVPVFLEECLKRVTFGKKKRKIGLYSVLAFEALTHFFRSGVVGLVNYTPAALMHILTSRRGLLVGTAGHLGYNWLVTVLNAAQATIRHKDPWMLSAVIVELVFQNGLFGMLALTNPMGFISLLVTHGAKGIWTNISVILNGVVDFAGSSEYRGNLCSLPNLPTGMLASSSDAPAMEIMSTAVALAGLPEPIPPHPPLTSEGKALIKSALSWTGREVWRKTKRIVGNWRTQCMENYGVRPFPENNCEVLVTKETMNALMHKGLLAPSVPQHTGVPPQIAPSALTTPRLLSAMTRCVWPDFMPEVTFPLSPPITFAPGQTWEELTNTSNWQNAYIHKTTSSPQLIGLLLCMPTLTTINLQGFNLSAIRPSYFVEEDRENSLTDILIDDGQVDGCGSHGTDNYQTSIFYAPYTHHFDPLSRFLQDWRYTRYLLPWELRPPAMVQDSFCINAISFGYGNKWLTYSLVPKMVCPRYEPKPLNSEMQAIGLDTLSIEQEDYQWVHSIVVPENATVQSENDARLRELAGLGTNTSFVFVLAHTSVPVYYPASSNANLKAMLLARVLVQPLLTAEEQEEVWRDMPILVRREWQPVHLGYQDLIAWAQQVENGPKRDKYLRAIEKVKEMGVFPVSSVSDLEAVAKYVKVFVKSNEMLPKQDDAGFWSLKPRAIANVPVELLVQLGPAAKISTQRLKEEWPWPHQAFSTPEGLTGFPLPDGTEFYPTFASASTPDLLSDWMEFLVFAGKEGWYGLFAGDDSLVAHVHTDEYGRLIITFYETDFGMYDSTQSRGVLRHEGKTHTALGQGEWVADLVLDTAHLPYRGVSKKEGDPPVIINRKKNPIRDTGGATTTFGNTDITGHAWYDVIRRCCGLLIITTQDLEQAFARLGFKVKAKIHDGYADKATGGPTFLKGWWLTTKGGKPRWTLLPSRILKLAKSHRDPVSLYKSIRAEYIAKATAAGRPKKTWAQDDFACLRNSFTGYRKGICLRELCYRTFMHDVCLSMVEAIDAPIIGAAIAANIAHRNVTTSMKLVGLSELAEFGTPSASILHNFPFQVGDHKMVAFKPVTTETLKNVTRPRLDRIDWTLAAARVVSRYSVPLEWVVEMEDMASRFVTGAFLEHSMLIEMARVDYS